MMVKPWAKAIAAIPGRPTPSPTTAAAPAPMNINAKVPMNSARSLGAIRLDIVDSRGERATWCDQLSGKKRFVLGGWPTAREERRRPAEPLDLFRRDRLRFEIDAKRLRDACAVGRIRLGAIGDMTLLDVQPGVAHRPRGVLEQQLLLLRRHFAKEVAGLLPMIIVNAVVPVRGIALDRHRRLGEIR